MPLAFSFFIGKEPSTAVNADEAVAYGAAVQAGVLSGERDKVTEELLLLDVTPLTLGLEVTGGVMDKAIPRNSRPPRHQFVRSLIGEFVRQVIPRNTVVPASASKTYTNQEDGQAAVSNKVFEGERQLTRDNRLLGQFELSRYQSAD